jgi:tetratricopeptide (TPR) repeat protein
MTHQKSLVALSVLLTLASQAAAQTADNKELARTRWAEGTRLYDVGEYRAALERFKSAYLVYEEPAFLYNMGQCYRQLDERADAIRSYRSYLRRVPDAPNRQEVEDRIRQLEHQPRKVLPPNDTAPPTTAPAVAAPASPLVHSGDRLHRPIYKRWWLWTTVVGVAVAGAAVGVGVWYATRPPDFSTTLPSFSHSGLTVRF